MIPTFLRPSPAEAGKPRASGDDPYRDTIGLIGDP